MRAAIDLRLYASLAAYLPVEAQNFPITAGVTISEVLETIQVPLQEVKLIFVNGVRAEANQTLNGGERVGVFPPIGGG